jgi:hypothetical protein
MFPNNKKSRRAKGCWKTEIENDFQESADGCKIRRAYRIFGYTRRDKLFIAFEADRFNHSRTSPVDQLTVQFASSAFGLFPAPC